MRIITMLAFLFVVSCTGRLRPIIKDDNRVRLTKDNFSQLNGDYEVQSTDTSIVTLDFALTFRMYYNKPPFDSLNKITLKVIDDNHLQVTVFKNKNIVANKTIKGKIKNEYFEFKTSQVSPFWIIINGFKSKRTRIGQIKPGDLIVDSKYRILGTIVIIPFTGERGEVYNLIFRKKTSS